LDKAEDAFGRVKEASLSLEGLAAVACEQAEGNAARTQIVDALGKAKTAYLQTLLGSLDVNATQYQQAAETLQGAQAGKFTYQWQKAECLQALGQAYYHLNQFQQSAQVFDSLRGISPSYVEVADRYIQLANNALNEDRRQEVMKKAEEIRKLMASDATSMEIVDEWTSRPLTFAILPGDSANSRLAVKSGMADVLPMLLGDSLVSRTSMKQVDRDLINEVLTEQQLSALLGSKTKQIQLGKVLGARLFVRCNFIRYDDNEKLRPQVVDAESTLDVPADAISIPLQSGLDETASAVAESVWNAVKESYPLQGRLTVKDGQAEINIGSKVGVVQGARFSVLMKPGQAELPNRAVLGDGPVGEDSTTVRLEGFSVDEIPAEGWSVKGELGSRQEGQ
jgi:tetratricopeptide (TPR) repeat protein